MNNALATFESEGMALMQQIAGALKTKKEIEAQEKALKAELLNLMEEYDVKSVDNEYVRITYVAGGESHSIDLKALEDAEPELYRDLVNDYHKVTKRAPSIRITVK